MLKVILKTLFSSFLCVGACDKKKQKGCVNWVGIWASSSGYTYRYLDLICAKIVF